MEQVRGVSTQESAACGRVDEQSPFSGNAEISERTKFNPRKRSLDFLVPFYDVNMFTTCYFIY